MYRTVSDIVRQADAFLKCHGTRDPEALVQQEGILVLSRPFHVQKGAYKVILRNRFIFIKSDLSPLMRRIVLLHELGHDQLHREESIRLGGFQEFNIFDMRDNRMEYEANLFAAELSLPDEDVLDYIGKGYDIQQIAHALHSDINLVALKADLLIARGYRLNRQEHSDDFLRFHH